MMTTLEAQKERLLEELQEIQEQVQQIKSQPCPDVKILNYYMDTIARNTQLIEMIDCHIFGEKAEIADTWLS